MSRDIYARIEHSLRIRSAPEGSWQAKAEQLVKAKGGKLWAQVKKRPSVGVLLVAGAGLVLADLVGVGELAVAAAAGYAAYQVLSEGRSMGEAAANVMRQLEKFG